MPTNFNLILDTTGPAGVTVSINSGDAYTAVRDVLLAIATSDADTTGYQMKVWGDVDLTNDANVQDTEAASSWITFNASQAVRLSTGDAVKNVFVKLRDDVWNVSSQATDTITLDTTSPVPNVTIGVSPSKISKIATKDTATAGWTSDSDFVAYTVRVVPSTSSPHTAGTQIPTTAGSVNTSGGSGTAGATVTTTIKGADLETAGAEGSNIIKVFVQDAAGNWSV